MHFEERSTREKTSVFHEGRPDSMKADIHKEWSQKQLVKVILTAGTHSVRVVAIETKSLENDGCSDRYFVYSK